MFLQYDEKTPALRRDGSPDCERASCGPCICTARPTQALTNLEASAVAERPANVPVQRRSNPVLRIRKERTCAQFDLPEVHKSCRSSTSMTASPVSSRNFFPCLQHDKANRDARRRTSEQSPDTTAHASSNQRSSTSMRPIATRSSANRSTHKVR